MDNGRMPAMPTLTYDHGAAMQGLAVSVTDAPGLTKREMMAMHICAAITGSIHDEECYLRIKAMSDRCGVKVSEWIARDAVKQTDALLAELERTCQKP